jgi:translation initiation factor eIF-2B subunit delta
LKAKKCLNEEIERFIDEKILLAWETISKYMLANSEVVISGTSYAKSKITNDDCLLIYGSSSLVLHVLIQASRKFSNIHVIVVDSRPNLKGKIVLEQLVKNGFKCSYILINAISFVMNRVTKVILGADALLANGYVMSSIGSSQIALVAKSFNVPVVVCCETYKFCEKVQTDALVNNELGNPMDLLSYSSRTINQKSPLAHWTQENKETENINILNLVYDVTPPDLIVSY